MIESNNNPSDKKCICTGSLLCRTHFESRQRIFGKTGKHVSATVIPRRWHVDITCPKCNFVNRDRSNECTRCGECIR